jgi:predicted CoA-binding protein
MKTSRASINSFLETRKLAIAGVSRDQKKFGYAVLRKLKEIGYDLYLIHPDTDSLHGEPCYRNISLLPGGIGGLLIITPKTETLGVVKDAVKKGIPNLWIQQMSETSESIEYALNNNINLITGQCIFMFAEPVEGFHKFHRNLKKLFGRLPKSRV